MILTTAIRLSKDGSEYNKLENPDGDFVYAGFVIDIHSGRLVSVYFPRGFDLSKYKAGTTFIVDMIMSPGIVSTNERPIPTYRMYITRIKTINRGYGDVSETDGGRSDDV